MGDDNPVQHFHDPVERQEMLDALAEQRRRLGNESDQLSHELKVVREIAKAEIEKRDAEIIALRERCANLEANVNRLTANPADHRYWEGRYRDEKIRADAMKERAAAIADEHAAESKRLGATMTYNEKYGAECSADTAEEIATAIRAIDSETGD